jgi:anti-sigma regulatory factor (Ser/Thr protein kinase)
MKELSLNILDIAENSVRANASLITISVTEDTAADTLTISVADNGCGMSPEFLAHVCDPFTTTRTTRKIGLGIPLFKEAAEATGGNLTIRSEVGKGTETTAVFTRSHIDRMPLGDVASTISTLIQCNDDRDFIYHYTFDGNTFTLDTRELRTVLGGVALSEPDVVVWIREYIRQNTKEINGGKEA